jgi:hypothetical protein
MLAPYGNNTANCSRGEKILMERRKFHLINWNIVRAPKNKNGLGIKDLPLVNLAMGTKHLWIMITGNLTWWKKVLKKYFQGDRNRCIDGTLEVKRGFHITWILVNARLIKIRSDGIMENNPLKPNQELISLKYWMDTKNILTLFDISMCFKSTGRWIRWSIGSAPSHLHLPLIYRLLSPLSSKLSKDVPHEIFPLMIDKVGVTLKNGNLQQIQTLSLSLPP